MSKIITIEKSKGRLNVKLQLIDMGIDCCVIITGGDTPHLGAITVGEEGEIPTTVGLKNHKEDIVTKVFYDEFRKITNRNCVVCCGIHLDNISKQEIANTIDIIYEFLHDIKLMSKEGKLWI